MTKIRSWCEANPFVVSVEREGPGVLLSVVIVRAIEGA